MPMDKSRYPDDWDEISLRIRERDGWKCKTCGAPNGKYIVRSDVDKAKYIVYDEVETVYTWPDGESIRMSEIPEEFAGKESKVVLTVHHKGVPKPDGSPGDRHDKMDCRDENLDALCQRCHFIADIDIHIVNARATRLRKKKARKLATGQHPMF